MNPDDRQEPGKGWARSFQESAPYIGVGSSLAASLLLSIGAGYWLDKKFGTEPLFLLVGAGFGLLAGVYHFYKLYRLMMGGKR